MKETQPPRQLTRFINWLFAPHLREQILGDLQERYIRRVKVQGEASARRRYWLEALAYMRPAFIKRQKSEYPSTVFYNPDMIHNYFKIAFRNLSNNKGYSAINIGGLAVGMGVAMLIGLWVYDELSFNKYHKNYDRIAVILQNEDILGEKQTWKSLPFPFINELKANYGENFKHIVASTQTGGSLLTVGEKQVTKTGQFVEPDGPEMLSLEMVSGSWAGLQQQQSILLSESTAKALFGDSDPMNQIVQMDTDKNAKVTGVYKDISQNSEFHNLQFLSTWQYFLATNAYMAQKKWDNHALWIYVEIKPETSFDKATAAIRNSELNVIRHIENMKEEAGYNPQMWLNRMSNWHLYSNFKNGVADQGPVQYVWLVGVIGFFVLLLACINFMNLSTARSAKRAKEVGIRKAVGSLRGQLIGQFFSESFIVVIISFLIALTLVYISLSWFNDLAAKQMLIPWTNLYFWMFNLVFISITGVLAGIYPALYLTSFQPVRVLKGATVHLGRFASLPRKILVSMQFTVSITLVICTLIVYNQVQFAKNRPVGYSRDGLMMVSMQTEFFEKADVLQSELKNTGVVSEVALSQSPTTGAWSTNNGFTWRGNEMGTDEFASLSISPEYAKTVGLEFIAGRNFSKEYASDSTGFVINETAARLMGFNRQQVAEAVGFPVRWKSKWMTGDIRKQFKVLGVVKDMIMDSPFEKVKPTAFMLFGNPNWINIKLRPQVATSVALPKIAAVFKRFSPSRPFEYQFADLEYDAKFRSEERIGKLTSFFASLAIFISCLGLFGLASFVAEQRKKEIGIRKVLGASLVNLWVMLSRDFLFLATIGFTVATPLACYFLNTWLAKYDYRAELSWWIFAATGAGALVITLVTVSFQSLKAALLDPVKSLRSE
ncbi:ABC transporter permease [Dyadobacter frigoris]|uniref:FtsX-like permease family protein n=1 Tax=Dyadobacter frigoris TaxID=2576211 RepID=A0A4U6D1B3_9BACT|nr:ABC transporter permease [Dyadobacter frigoris]TKT87574.1 FtsX-like permease family protein [Dyadobacter frigoris]